MSSSARENSAGFLGGAAALLLLTLIPSSILGQTRITGTVVDAETGEPLPGANVFIDGEMLGTATDDQGHFALTDLRPGNYTVVASMVGYGPRNASVTLKSPADAEGAAPNIRFELVPRPVELKGVKVEGSRDEWLDRLARFRRAFFGIGVPNADQCSFVNPEVLSFETSGSSLIAHAEKPLRVRNDALGYEVTYYLPRYEVSPENRTRLGPFEFDTLEPQSKQQRKEWAKTRRKTYRGSLFHFVDALRTGSLDEEGFRVRTVNQMMEESDRRRRGGRFSEPPEGQSLKSPDIFRFAESPGLGELFIPRSEREHEYLEVRYLEEGENPQFVDLYRSGRSPRPYQRSWLQFVGKKEVLIDLETGDFIVNPKLGRIIQHGYWGWYGTAATALPGEYEPSGMP